MSLLKDKVALITGGSRGIGEAIVRRFATEGAKVIFTYISSRDKADAIATELNGAGADVTAVMSDASSYVESEGLVMKTVDQHGSLDILVNNAGITRDTLMLRMDEEQWDQVIDTNLKSVFNMTKHGLRPMLRQRSGSIINLSSVVGISGNAGQANYAASKAGIIGFTKSIAKELGSRNIRCNAIAPGFIETDMTGELDEQAREQYLSGIPLKRLGSGEDIANAALYLGSDLSVYVTGQVLSVCGGLNA